MTEPTAARGLTYPRYPGPYAMSCPITVLHFSLHPDAA